MHSTFLVATSIAAISRLRRKQNHLVSSFISLVSYILTCYTLLVVSPISKTTAEISLFRIHFWNRLQCLTTIFYINSPRGVNIMLVEMKLSMCHLKYFKKAYRGETFSWKFYFLSFWSLQCQCDLNDKPNPFASATKKRIMNW